MTIQALTFDYFGTLVDVDLGGTRGMEAVLARLGIDMTKSAAALYLDWDIRTVRLYRGAAYRRYRSVAQDAMQACFDTLAPGVLNARNAASVTDLFLSHLVESSPAHAEAIAFLEWASAHFPLMPITNMDSDLWQRSQLTRYFEHVTTAEMARAYKPSQAIFTLALDRLGLPASSVLHCSLASWADIDGAKPLGMRVAWINRGNEVLGTWQPRPDYEFSTLSPVRDTLQSLHTINLGE